MSFLSFKFNMLVFSYKLNKGVQCKAQPAEQVDSFAPIHF